MQKVFKSLLNKPTKPKMWGVGMNFAANDEQREQLRQNELFVFQKPTTGLVSRAKELDLRRYREEGVLAELEVGFVIGQQVTGGNVSLNQAQDAIAGYFLTLDLTSARISELRSKQYPICLAKGLDNFTPVSGFIDREDVQNPGNLDLSMSLPGSKNKVTYNTSQLVFNFAEIVQRLSKYVTLNEGDLILSGTMPPPRLQDGQVKAFLKDQDKKTIGKLSFKALID